MAGLAILALTAFFWSRKSSPPAPVAPRVEIPVHTMAPAVEPPRVAVPSRRPVRPVGAPPETAQEAVAATNGNIVATDEADQLLRDLRAWAAKDPDAALAEAMKLPPGDERERALSAVCFGIAETHPADAVKLAQSLQQPESVMENLVQQWSSADLVSAMVWVNEQPAGEQRDEFVQRVAFVLSQSDPANAAGLVTEQIPPGPAQDEAMMTVLHQWADRNVSAAADWIATYPFRSAQLQDRALSELEGMQNYQKALAGQ
jgi:hypothetical protein